MYVVNVYLLCWGVKKVDPDVSSALQSLNAPAHTPKTPSVWKMFELYRSQQSEAAAAWNCKAP